MGRASQLGLKMSKTPGEHAPIRPLTKEEREARQAFGKAKPSSAMSDLEAEQTAFSDNRERLKAERLEREALESAKKSRPRKKSGV